MFGFAFNGNFVQNVAFCPAMQRGLFAARPVGYNGLIYVAYDTQQIFQFVTGLGWVLIAGAGAGSGTTLQQAIDNGNVLDKDNTIDSTGFDLFLTTKDFTHVASGPYGVVTTDTMQLQGNSLLELIAAAGLIKLDSTNGDIEFDASETVSVKAAQDFVMGDRQVHTSTLTVPTISLNANAGVGATATVTGDNISGQISITFGAGATAVPNTVIGTLTFGTPYVVAPNGAIYSANNGSGRIYLSGQTVNGCDISNFASLAAVGGLTSTISYWFV